MVETALQEGTNTFPLALLYSQFEKQGSHSVSTWGKGYSGGGHVILDSSSQFCQIPQRASPSH